MGVEADVRAVDSPGASGEPVPGSDSGTGAQKSDVGMDKRLSGVLNSLVDPERLAEVSGSSGAKAAI